MVDSRKYVNLTNKKLEPICQTMEMEFFFDTENDGNFLSHPPFQFIVMNNRRERKLNRDPSPPPWKFVSFV